jgi:prepilin-type N-terminal cleavage/methylation domain-containing protein
MPVVRDGASCLRLPGAGAAAVSAKRRKRTMSQIAGKSPSARQAGYSLIEILVAMAIMSLAVSIVVPNAFDLVVRFQRLTERSAALDALSKCRMEAVISNEVISLDGIIRASEEPLEENRCLVLPANWTAEFEDPLVFSPAGICRGSSVILIAPNGDTVSYNLERGTCEFFPVSG